MKQLMTYEELKSRFIGIPDKFWQACFMVTYACLGREGEIVRPRYRKENGLYKSDVEFNAQEIIFQVLTEKTQKRRRVVLPLSESWLSKPITDFVNAAPEGALFPYSTRWAEKKFVKFFPDISKEAHGHTIHLLRSWRASHWLQGKVTGQPAPRQFVAMLGGWSNVKILDKIYDKTGVEDYAHLWRGK